VVELSQIGFGFAPERAVLDGVDLAVSSGELVAIVGPNGAGKSTLLRIIAGLLAPDRGQARVFGEPPSSAKRRQLARRLAFLPQSYGFSFPFTALEVVLMGRYAHERRGLLGLDSQDALAQARQALEQVGAADLEGRRMSELSGGEVRRVQIAQALCQQAALLLLDEPTAALDPGHALELLHTLRSAVDSGERTVVLATHDLNLAGRFAHRVVLLHEGKLVADGPAGEVLHSSGLSDVFRVPMHCGTLPGTRTPFVVPE
jgi:iron complex transport system ATP-binding protein